MTIALVESIETGVETIDWTNVRPVYRKLHTDFPLLTKPFGIELSPQTKLTLSQLITAIEVVDRNLDEIAAADSRLEFANGVIEFLAQLSRDRSWMTLAKISGENELLDRLGSLRNMIVARGIRDEFVETVASILAHTESKRHATTSRELIEHLIVEWRLTGHLTVLVLGRQSSPQFENFFYPFCEMMTAIDTIQDVRADYKAKKLNLKPEVFLYLRLLTIAAVRIPKLLWRFPARRQLLKYGLPFLTAAE